MTITYQIAVALKAKDGVGRWPQARLSWVYHQGTTWSGVEVDASNGLMHGIANAVDEMVRAWSPKVRRPQHHDMMIVSPMPQQGTVMVDTLDKRVLRVAGRSDGYRLARASDQRLEHIVEHTGTLENFAAIVTEEILSGGQEAFLAEITTGNKKEQA